MPTFSPHSPSTPVPESWLPLPPFSSSQLPPTSTVAYHKEQRFQAGDLAVEESLLVARSVVVAEGAAGAELLAVELLVARGGEAVVVAHGVDVSDAVLVGAVGVLAGLVGKDAGGGRGGERGGVGSAAAAATVVEETTAAAAPRRLEGGEGRHIDVAAEQRMELLSDGEAKRGKHGDAAVLQLHLAVEADLTLRHVVSGAEPRRVPETLLVGARERLR